MQDRVALDGETFPMKSRSRGTYHMRKGEKMVHCVRQLLDLNYEALRKKSSACFIARALESFYLIKPKEDEPDTHKLIVVGDDIH